MNDINNILHLSPSKKADLFDEILMPLLQRLTTKDSDLSGLSLTQEKSEEIIVKRESKQNTKTKSNSHEDYPDQIKKKAVALAVQKNNNSEAARSIREEYKEEGRYQSLCEKSIRQWREIQNMQLMLRRITPIDIVFRSESQLPNICLKKKSWSQ